MGILPVLTCRMWAEIGLTRWELPEAAGACSPSTLVSQAPWKQIQASAQGPQGSLRRVPDPAHQPRCPLLRLWGKDKAAAIFFLEMKMLTNTSQTLPYKPVDYSTAAMDHRLALIYYICTIDTYRNPDPPTMRRLGHLLGILHIHHKNQSLKAGAVFRAFPKNGMIKWAITVSVLSWRGSRFANSMQPLGTSTATELPALRWAPLQDSDRGQEQMPHFWALATQPVAQHCTEQQLCGPEDVFNVKKLTKSRSQIFKVLLLEASIVLQESKNNPRRGCGERQYRPLQQLPAAKLG